MTMSVPETRSYVDTDTCLENIAADVADEHHTVTAALRSSQKTYEMLSSRCARLRNAFRKREEELKKKEEELKTTALVDLEKFRETAARWQRKVTSANKRRDKMKAQLDKAKQDNGKLEAELRAKDARLEQRKHLTCNICLEKDKDRVTKCGHGFCASCIGRYFDIGAREVTTFTWNEDMNRMIESVDRIIKSVPCPICRTVLRPRHVWKVYLGGEESGENESEDQTGEDESDNGTE